MTTNQPRIDPQVAALFALAALSQPRQRSQIEPQRRRNEATAKAWSAVVRPTAEETSIRLPGPRGHVDARVFWPFRRRSPRVPLIVYFHGGGYAVGSPDSVAHLTRALCRTSQSIVVSVAYRLAPEHPFPAAIEDGRAATRWVRDNANMLGADQDAIFLAGDSAGANAAAAVALMLRDAGEELPAGLALLCPWLDMSLSSPSYLRYAPTDPVVDDASVRLLRDLYLQGTPVEAPLASPIFADLRGLPPTRLVVGEMDPLHDDAVTFAARLRSAGGVAELDFFAGMPHEFVCLPFVEAASRALRGIGSFVQRVAAGELEGGAAAVHGR